MADEDEQDRKAIEHTLATAPMFTDDGRPIETLEDLQRYDQEIRATQVCLDCGRTYLDHCYIHTFPCCPGECSVVPPSGHIGGSRTPGGAE